MAERDIDFEMAYLVPRHRYIEDEISDAGGCAMTYGIRCGYPLEHVVHAAPQPEPTAGNSDSTQHEKCQHELKTWWKGEGWISQCKKCGLFFDPSESASPAQVSATGQEPQPNNGGRIVSVSDHVPLRLIPGTNGDGWTSDPLPAAPPDAVSAPTREKRLERLLRQVRYTWPVMNLCESIPAAREWADEVDRALEES